jgi:hypothetical protein
MKSDHPVLDSRYLLFEAQQAHSYGLPANLALTSITTAPAKTAGLNHRIGSIKENFDADLVVWDSHPLSLGATPLQVYIDGISQLDNVFTGKPLETSIEPPPIASRPKSPLTLREDDDVLYPPPANEMEDAVLFTNVKEVLLRSSPSNLIKTSDRDSKGLFSVLAQHGKIQSLNALATSHLLNVRHVNLNGSVKFHSLFNSAHLLYRAWRFI